MASKHSDLLVEWDACRDANGNFKQVYEKADRLYKATAKVLEKQRTVSTRYFKKVDGQQNLVLCHLTLTIWAVCNALSRVSLNDPIFDYYHKLLGTSFFIFLFCVHICRLTKHSE